MFLALTVATPCTASAQDALPSSPTYVEIMRIAQDGRADSARAMVQHILATVEPTAPDYPEALYTAATLAASGDDARLLFSRVVVEHSASDWADRALLRLAQLDYGTGDTEGTINRIRRLMSDYPNSGVVAEATLWGARAAFERADQATACAWLEIGISRVGENVELRNQLAFSHQRCDGRAPVAQAPIRTPERRPIGQPEVTREVEAPTPPQIPAANPAPATDGGWRVQVAALSDPVAIQRSVRIIEQAGLTAFRVPGPGGLTKVQAGPFASRAAAEARLAQLTAAIGGKPYVVEVRD